MTSSEDCQALTFNRQADTESEFREDSTPFHVLGALDVPDFRPLIVSRRGRRADTQRPVWSCTTAGVFMLGGTPRTHAEPEASHTKARDSGFSQAGGSPRHHLLRQGAAGCKEEQPKSACLVRRRNNPVWTLRPLLQGSRNSEARLLLKLHRLE